MHQHTNYHELIEVVLGFENVWPCKEIDTIFKIFRVLGTPDEEVGAFRKCARIPGPFKKSVKE